jgi:xylose isomerase|tara:strand:+ start:24270 stop:25577 length:1308 start_codon:yes stop_codon:yes gene_type:complete
MSHKIFNHIPTIEYKGMQNKDALAYSYYEADREIYGHTMRDHLRFAVCYWHSFNWSGNDVFGEGALPRPWLNKKNNYQDALNKLDAAFDFFERLGAPFFCFHDVDAAAHANTIKELTENVKKIAEPMGIKMIDTGVKLLWGTANLFSHPRYMAGAATNPDPEIFKCAAAQVLCMLETTHQLDGENYVLWGGREGYDSLLNTNIKQELDQLARFLTLVVEHKHKIGFKGTLLIEPKPHEPTKHQYDRDVATVVAFLERYNLQDEIKLNIEANHATMAGSSFEHEVANAFALNAFGSIDINRGDPQNGWDTDQFHNDPKEMALVMRHILMNGGMKNGGFNFDAKLRRQSIDTEDLFIAHIGGIDNLARGLINGIKLIEEKILDGFLEKRYQNWFNEEGQRILSGKLSLEHLSRLAQDPKPRSGKQEFLENYLNRTIE